MPRAGHRRHFLGYLWCGLGLRDHPEELADLWRLVELAWQWNPLTAEDWALLGRLDCTGETNRAQRNHRRNHIRRAADPTTAQEAPSNPSPVQGQVAAPPESDSQASLAAAASEVVDPALPSSSAGPLAVRGAAPPASKYAAADLAAPLQTQRRRWPLVAGLGLLVVAAVVSFFALPPRLDQAEGMGPVNLSFESGRLEPWVVAGSQRCAVVQQDARRAKEGSHFLRIDPRQGRCTALRYRLAFGLEAGDLIRFGIWARAAAPGIQSIGLALFEEGAAAVEHPPHPVDSGHWRCLEAALTVAAGMQGPIYADIRLPDAGMEGVELDLAAITINGGSLCAAETPHLVDSDFEDSRETLAWTFAGQPCSWSWIEESTQAQSGRAFVRIRHDESGCGLLFQEATAAPGATYRARLWLRAAGDQPLRATWMLNAAGSPALVARQPVVLLDKEWRCVETTLPVTGSHGSSDRLRTTLILETAGGHYDLDNAALMSGEDALCPPQEPLLNPGFEAGATVTPWETIGDCVLSVQHDLIRARRGRHYLQIVKDEGCHSLFQDVYAPLAVGDLRTFSLWVRSPHAPHANGRLALWAIGARNEQRFLDFTLEGSAWTCLQVTLPVAYPGHRHWRAELYLYADGAEYHLDDASLTPGDLGRCPDALYFVRRFTLLPRTVPHPGETISGLVVVENESGIPVDRRHQIHLWLAQEPYGAPMGTEANALVTVPPLGAGEISGPLYFDLRLPQPLATGQPYYMVYEFASFRANMDDVRASRQRLPLHPQPCAEGSFYCDIPDGFWAQQEVEALYQAGITTGCRTDVKPYAGLPFCPHQLLWLDYLAVFLLRHRHGPGYQPAAVYRGIYEDVPATRLRVLYLEELHDHLGAIERANCRQLGAKPVACLEMPMLRRDLLRYISSYLQIQPEPGVPHHFMDLTGDTEIAALANHLWATGILPQDDPGCPNHATGPRFCPDEPARRVDAAVWLARALGLVEVTPHRTQP